jgi:carbamoyl-phosphate synthase large subunit
LVQLQQALRLGATPSEVFEATKIDPWFIDQVVLINELAEWFAGLAEIAANDLH